MSPLERELLVELAASETAEVVRLSEIRQRLYARQRRRYRRLHPLAPAADLPLLSVEALRK